MAAPGDPRPVTTTDRLLVLVLDELRVLNAHLSGRAGDAEPSAAPKKRKAPAKRGRPVGSAKVAADPAVESPEIRGD